MKIRCSRCHTPDAWKQLLFDHSATHAGRSTALIRKLPATPAHKPQTDADGQFVTYRPLAFACSDCHSRRNSSLQAIRYLPASSARPLLIYLLLLAGIGSVRADFNLRTDQLPLTAKSVTRRTNGRRSRLIRFCARLDDGIPACRTAQVSGLHQLSCDACVR